MTRASGCRDYQTGSAGWVADRAIDCLRSRIGFSLIRLGDGEGRLLSYPGEIDQKRMNKHLHYWFGRTDFHRSEILMMRAALEQAIGSADVIGVYLQEDRNTFWAAPLRYVDRIGRNYAEGMCSIGVHRVMWRESHLDRVAGACERILVVTCRDVVHSLQTRYSRDVLWIAVPEEANTSGQWSDHWLEFDKIQREVASASGSGVLALVGAGVLGKTYTTTAAYCGAVALDIGSVFDGWAGVESRSYLTANLARYTL